MINKETIRGNWVPEHGYYQFGMRPDDEPKACTGRSLRVSGAVHTIIEALLTRAPIVRMGPPTDYGREYLIGAFDITEELMYEVKLKVRT